VVKELLFWSCLVISFTYVIGENVVGFHPCCSANILGINQKFVLSLSIIIMLVIEIEIQNKMSLAFI